MLKTIHLYSFLFILTLNAAPHLSACTIFMANDGKHIWIGNNEDELQQLKYRLWFYPSQKDNFGYVIWTERSPGKLQNDFAYLNPQGGLNDQGLFMDYTAIDEIQVSREPNRTDRNKQVVSDILKTCKTVDEAISYLKQFNLVRLNQAQLFIGDATGNYVTVTANSMVRKTSNNFALTNYSIADNHSEACHRRDVAIQRLQSSGSFDLPAIKGILEKSAQKMPNNLISNFSMAIDLKSKTIHLYYKTDFSTAISISLSQELGKAKHHVNMEDLFPADITLLLEEELKVNGIDSVVSTYSVLRNAGDSKYNFTNDDALKLAIKWIEKDQTFNALQLLECLKRFDSAKADIYSWLGVAYRRVEKLKESENNFIFALSIDSNNYVAQLFGKQKDQIITFNLRDFEAAEQVFVMGAFTNWTKNPIKMKKAGDVWTCQVSLPKGPVSYKFIVNNQYLADSKNYLHTGTGPDIFSKLYVW